MTLAWLLFAGCQSSFRSVKGRIEQRRRISGLLRRLATRYGEGRQGHQQERARSSRALILLFPATDVPGLLPGREMPQEVVGPLAAVP